MPGLGIGKRLVNWGSSYLPAPAAAAAAMQRNQEVYNARIDREKRRVGATALNISTETEGPNSNNEKVAFTVTVNDRQPEDYWMDGKDLLAVSDRKLIAILLEAGTKDRATIERLQKAFNNDKDILSKLIWLRKLVGESEHFHLYPRCPMAKIKIDHKKEKACFETNLDELIAEVKKAVLYYSTYCSV